MFDVKTLLADPPKLHMQKGALTSSWHVHDDVAYAFDSLLQADMPTMETGAGFSTIMFAAKRCDHVCIVPDAGLIERIKDYCTGHDISTKSVHFIAKKSCDVVYELKSNSFDVVLIDGNHGFPSVFVDFFYGAKALKPGGRLFQDDMHIYSCRLIYEFMKEDSGWNIEKITDRVLVAQKLSDTIETEWISQPLNLRRSYHVHKRPMGLARATVRSLLKNGPRATLEKIKTRLGIWEG